MKIASKKEISAHKQGAKKTGGGPMPAQQAMEIQYLLPLDFSEGTNEFDCDAEPDNLETVIIDSGNLHNVSPQPADSSRSLCVDVPGTPIANGRKEFNLRMETFVSQEKYRQKEDVRQEQVHSLKLDRIKEQFQCMREQYAIIMEQNKILLEMLKESQNKNKNKQ